MSQTVSHLLGEEHETFRQSVRRFAEREIAPLVDEAEASGRFPVQIMARAGELGFLAVGYPETLGGGGVGLSFECILVEECARVCAGITSGMMLQTGLGTSLIHQFGNPEQHAQYLIPALRGEKLGCYAMTEPDAGSDVLGMRGTATRTANGYRVRANKVFITCAPFADFIVLVVYTDPAARQKGLSVFIVDRHQPGIEVRTLRKLGHHSMETGQLTIECEVPATALLGEEGRGMAYLLQGLEKGRITHAARSLGVATAATELARSYTAERRQFGKALNEFQAVQFELARMEIDVTTAALHVYSAALKHEHGERSMVAASMAKVVASEVAERVTSRALHLHGGYGYMAEYPIERLFRDAKLYPITEGTTEIQLRTIARELRI